MKGIFYLLGALFFVFLQSFFSAVEIACISISPLRLKRREKDKAFSSIQKLLRNPERFFSTVLVGINISVVASTTFITYYFIELGIRNSNLWVTLFFTPFVVMFAELIPKNVGRYYKDIFVTKIIGIFKVFQAILYPLVLAIEKITAFFVGLLVKKKKRSPFVVREEIKALVLEAEKEGSLERGEREAIEDIFDFGETKIKDVCVPVKNVVGIDYTDSWEKIKEKVNRFKFTRYPVFSNRQIIGYINIFDIFYAQDVDWHKFIRPITIVGASQKLYEVFNMLKTKKENIAVVMRGKKILGIVTLEDIMREILVSLSK